MYLCFCFFWFLFNTTFSQFCCYTQCCRLAPLFLFLSSMLPLCLRISVTTKFSFLQTYVYPSNCMSDCLSIYPALLVLCYFYRQLDVIFCCTKNGVIMMGMSLPAVRFVILLTSPLSSSSSSLFFLFTVTVVAVVTIITIIVIIAFIIFC